MCWVVGRKVGPCATWTFTAIEPKEEFLEPPSLQRWKYSHSTIIVRAWSCFVLVLFSGQAAGVSSVHQMLDDYREKLGMRLQSPHGCSEFNMSHENECIKMGRPPDPLEERRTQTSQASPY